VIRVALQTEGKWMTNDQIADAANLAVKQVISALPAKSADQCKIVIRHAIYAVVELALAIGMTGDEINDDVALAKRVLLTN